MSSAPAHAALLTPVKKVAVERPVVESPGTWKHPRLDEIQRRRNASTFTEKNVRQIFLSLAALVILWAVDYISAAYFGPESLSQSTRWFFSWIFTFLHAAPIANIGVACLPLVRAKDTMADIPLSNEQRQLLGLPLCANAPAADVKINTPPRYSRTPSMAGFVNSRVGYGGSLLSDLNDLPASSNMLPLKSSQYAPMLSPLAYKSARSPNSTALSLVESPSAMKTTFGSSTATSPGMGPGNSLSNFSASLVSDVGSPSPSKRASVGLNSKWLYEKSRRQGSDWCQ
ncbi:hypothetical protein TD95_002467 [Thielaviopsis punctulata]|uniref:Nucleoporin POM34 n=1 Tax=Thielaviopsis punctulata TaxID=72032 RepID=A0A0F4ZA64_9PEZI|nr:hypothetical protein TD95_002467 [Thielaviopsis punctulata]